MAGSDYPQGEQPAPPRNASPSWKVWTIVGAATAVVLAVIIVAIAKVGGGGIGGTGGSAESATTSSAPLAQGTMSPVDELRSHMPEELRSMTECRQTDAGIHATAAIHCVWAGPVVPTLAGYSLHADAESMNTDAEEAHQGNTRVRSCASADDFTAGGQTPWTSNDGRGRGTTWCYVNADQEPVVLWTDDTLHILSFAVAPALADWQQLLAWFDAAGPV